MRMDLRNSLVGYGSHIAISLAGPLANGLAAVVLFCLHSPQAALVHLVLAGVNLLPVSALDGGELLRYSLCLLEMDHLSDSLLRFTSALVMLPLAAVSIWLFIKVKNPTLLIVSGYLIALIIFSEKNEKTS